MRTGARARARSTSLHRLNADPGLRRPGRIAWSWLNAVNNLLPSAALDKRLEVRDFLAVDPGAHWERLAPGASPARMLSDLFWMTLPWTALADPLGPIHVLDVGCGKGYYGPRLVEWSGEVVESYLGIDAVPRSSWAELAACDPAAACRSLYRAHGVRQYTPRTISRATGLYESPARFVLFRLGGERCIEVHRAYITQHAPGEPELRATSPARYAQAVESAARSDLHDRSGPALFYALAIASGPEVDL